MGLQNPLATLPLAVDLPLDRRRRNVAKKTKIDTEKQANGQGAGLVARSVSNARGTKAKGKKAPPKKGAVGAQKTTGFGKGAPSASRYEPSDEEIRVRAYFIAERRLQLSLAGDSDHDWIEAKRQLIDEASRSAL
jgi:hypothetical protein